MKPGLHITPAMMEAAYDYLRTTPPFRRWKLPDGDGIEFHVTRDTATWGDCLEPGAGRPDWRLRVSGALIGHTSTLMALLAHEMVHMRQILRGQRPTHGALFQRLAAQVCRHHGFDPKLF